ncbi:hypothetical protein TNIN_208381, partial [Trichonephila inaurata madagascariensis]
ENLDVYRNPFGKCIYTRKKIKQE